MTDTSTLALQLLSATLFLEGTIITLILTIIYYTPQEDF